MKKKNVQFRPNSDVPQSQRNRPQKFVGENMVTDIVKSWGNLELFLFSGFNPQTLKRNGEIWKLNQEIVVF